MTVRFFTISGTAITMFVTADLGDFSGKIMDMPVAKSFRFSGSTAIWMLMAVVATGFAFKLMLMARLVRRWRGYAPDDVAVAIFDRSVVTVIMDVITFFFRFLTPMFIMFFTHGLLPPVFLLLIYVERL
jgi:hypothetical protein